MRLRHPRPLPIMFNRINVPILHFAFSDQLKRIGIKVKVLLGLTVLVTRGFASQRSSEHIKGGTACLS
jgi:hypothetical protein